VLTSPRMRAVAGLVAVAAVAVVAAVALRGSPGTDASAPGPPASASPSPTVSPTGGSAAASPDGTAGGPAGGSEVPTQVGRSDLPTSPAPATTPSGTLSAGYPVLRGPLPPVASAVGSLVSGFPSTLIPMPADTEIVLTTVTSEGSILQAGLEGRTTGSIDDVVAFYRDALAAEGFTASQQTPIGSGQAWHFLRGAEGLALSARGLANGGAGFSVAGTFVARG